MPRLQISLEFFEGINGRVSEGLLGGTSMAFLADMFLKFSDRFIKQYLEDFLMNFWKYEKHLFYRINSALKPRRKIEKSNLNEWTQEKNFTHSRNKRKG